MKYFLPLLLSLPLYGAKTGETRGMIHSTDASASTQVAPAVPPPAIKNSVTGYMAIDPSARAKDLKEALGILRKDTLNNKIALLLSNGSQITNIIDFYPTQNGTLLIVKYALAQVTKELILPIEAVVGLEQL